MIDDWDLTATNLSRLQGRPIEVAVLPTAAIEPHNRHLPQGQDLRHTDYVARRCCRDAHARGAAVICLPAIPYGVDCNLLDFPLAVHVRQSTLDAMVGDVVRSLAAHGVRKVVLVNGHGGNDFLPLVRQLQADAPVHLFLCDWWKVGADQYARIFDRPDDHAGQMETSVALALFPELVELEKAGDGAVRPFAFEALNRGWVRTSRRFRRLNDHCAAGDPAGASAARGQAYLDLVCGRITDFLVQLSATPVGPNFPQGE